MPAKELREIHIPVENILIAATHTHTGPLFWGALRKHFHDQAVAKYGSDPYEKVNYPLELTRKIVQAITQANASLIAIQLEAGKTLQHDFPSINAST